MNKISFKKMNKILVLLILWMTKINFLKILMIMIMNNNKQNSIYHLNNLKMIFFSRILFNNKKKLIM